MVQGIRRSKIDAVRTQKRKSKRLGIPERKVVSKHVLSSFLNPITYLYS
jgi:hypothetical protein